MSPARVTEAWLDVVASDGLGTDFYIDATIRNPLCQRYLEVQSPNAATETNFATKVAQQEKQKRYPPTDGYKVTTAAAESYGRIGDELAELLTVLHGMAQQNDLRRGQPPCNWRGKWLAQICVAIARNVAVSIDEAIEVQGFSEQ